MRHFYIGFAAILWLPAAACTDAAGPHSALFTRIDRAWLDSSKVLTATFTVTNHRPYNEQISACHGDPIPEWEKLENGAWEGVFGGPDDCPAPAIFSGVISIAPGAELHGTTGFWEGEPGTYRLVFHGVDGVAHAVSEPSSVR